MPSISLIFLSIARIRHVTTVVIELRSKESGIVASSVERVYDDVVKFHAVLSAAADALGFAPPPINTSDAFFASLRTASTKPHLTVTRLVSRRTQLSYAALSSRSNPQTLAGNPLNLDPASDFHQARVASVPLVRGGRYIFVRYVIT
jgi:hypothetical protein